MSYSEGNQSMSPESSREGAVPPGPEGLPLLGNTLDFGRHTFEFLQGCRRDFGDVTHFEVLGQSFYQVNNPDDIEYVLVDNNTNYTKGRFLTGQFGDLIGDGLLLNDGDAWRRQRRIVQPAFHPDRIAVYTEMMTDCTERLLRSWKPGSERDIQADMTRLTLEIISRALFDVDIRGDVPEISDAFTAVMEEVRLRTARPVSFPQWIPTPRNRRYQRALATLDEIVYDVIALRRECPGRDVVSMLLAAQGETNDESNREQLRDEVVTLLIAGHETTAIALTFAWFLLATHADAEACFHAELKEVLNGRTPTLADVPRLEFTSKVIKETLRLYPPVFGVLREPIDDDVVGGYRIPAGTTVAMNQIAVHYDPRFFDDPEVFDPDRWTSDFEATLPRFAYFPFGGGPRRCIGERFALLEATLVLATIGHRYCFDLASERELQLMPSVTTRPKHPIRVIPQER